MGKEVAAQSYSREERQRYREKVRQNLDVFGFELTDDGRAAAQKIETAPWSLQSRTIASRKPGAGGTTPMFAGAGSVGRTRTAISDAAPACSGQSGPCRPALLSERC